MCAMLDWHRELPDQEPMELEGRTLAPFDKSGFPGGRFVVEEAPQTEWKVHEIHMPEALAAEGKAMDHCALSYRRRVRGGERSLWSLRSRDDLGRWPRELTIEVDNSSRLIVQARSRGNAVAGPAQKAAVAPCAAKARLHLDPWAWR